RFFTYVDAAEYLSRPLNGAEIFNNTFRQREHSTIPRVIGLFAHGMKGDTMFRPIIRMGAVAVVAGAIAIALAVSAAPARDLAPPPVQDASQPPAFAKADRLRVPLKGAACSVHGWPAFEPACQSDFREPAGAARTVRI